MELLLRKTHPNIIRYHGCLAKRGRMVELVLDRYDTTLKQRLDRSMIRNLESDNFVEHIESALEHLHGFGLAHNDLNPMTIMVDERH
ncbi:uncharacterized protein RHO25_008585 [Cercospora beticola]|uniref:Protein kinase domain-containing protein n=1 Tax=Cercospora beticola TaxID=122368 RepID=A0ABZ0NWR9_CERBT|nr:hypothetical protein RHO25_008585 [Cercospora beticola]